MARNNARQQNPIASVRREQMQVSKPRKLAAIESILQVISYVSAIASLLGLTLVSIISFAKNLFSDTWMLVAIICIALLVPLAVLSVYLFVSRRVLSISVLGEEFRGRGEVASKEKSLLSGASDSIAYIAGDFSHVHEIKDQLIAAWNHGITVRVLAADSPAPGVIDNLKIATTLHCEVRLYDKQVRRVKALIVDADQANAEGSVMFVKKVTRSPSTDNTSGLGNPGNDQLFEYIGRVYNYNLLVTAVGQMFDSWWEKARPFGG